MKTYLISTLGLVGSLALYAQDIPQSQVPALVITSLQQQFQAPKQVEWEKKGELYEAEFDKGTQDHHVWLNASGKVVKHTQEITETELPAAVQSTLRNQFAKARIEDLDKIEEEDTVTYKMEVKHNKVERKLVLNQEGKILEDRKDD